MVNYKKKKYFKIPQFTKRDTIYSRGGNEVCLAEVSKAYALKNKSI